ncbi:hypothetical protein [Novosphingobium lentum]|uniref:hypothetical protein n=1 Tax=Novosphingobium lentum TaxID=145287 RepID=UPI00082C2221|nr:hypothetical protein [Novosphingobium lentum]
MSSVLFLLALTAAPPHHAAAGKPHVVAPTAHRSELALKAKMETWRGKWRIEPAGVACATARSTGDVRLDTIGCRAIQACFAPKVSQVAAIEDGAGSIDEKKARLATLLDAGKPCIARNRALAIEILAGTRPPPRVATRVRETGR